MKNQEDLYLKKIGWSYRLGLIISNANVYLWLIHAANIVFINELGREKALMWFFIPVGAPQSFIFIKSNNIFTIGSKACEYNSFKTLLEHLSFWKIRVPRILDHLFLDILPISNEVNFPFPMLNVSSCSYTDMLFSRKYHNNECELLNGCSDAINDRSC